MKNQLPDNLFPERVKDLLHAMSGVGFFDHSVVIGSWVMLIYQELYGARYVLRTLDVDFAVQIVHTKSKLRADLKQLINGLGFADYLAAEGVQKFTGGGCSSDSVPAAAVKVFCPFRNGTSPPSPFHSSTS